MSTATNAQQAQPAMPAIRSPDEARRMADGLIDIMNALLKVVERETELVRGGDVREAITLDGQKSELSRRYVSAIGAVKANQRYLAQTTPELLAMLHRHHDVFRAMLQINLTVLATAHAVSEGIVRGVSGEMQKRAAPQTYNAAGYSASASARHAAPLAVSRTL